MTAVAFMSAYRSEPIEPRQYREERLTQERLNLLACNVDRHDLDVIPELWDSLDYRIAHHTLLYAQSPEAIRAAAIRMRELNAAECARQAEAYAGREL